MSLGKWFIILCCVCYSLKVASQDTINEQEVRNIITYLASDNLKGRGNGRKELLTAADYIAQYYRSFGLSALPVNNSFYLPFRPFGGSDAIIKDSLKVNNQLFPASRYTYYAKSGGAYAAKSINDFQVISMNAIDSIAMKDTTPLLVWQSLMSDDEIERVTAAASQRDLLFIASDNEPASVSLVANRSYYASTQYNIIGLLPGKTKPDEIICFSAHYDHEGVYPGERDSILNGANDDASGVTALMLLAKYYALRNDNERTIMFCAFSGEELGMYGSANFIHYIDPEQFIANINIEMIGVPQYGRRSYFITGKSYSNLPAILHKGLRKQGLTAIAEPNVDKQLFIRSDNYSFAVQGIPAHTIMTSDDDDECYHQPCDEIKRIDIPNMTKIIKAISVACRPLIDGSSSPTRTNPKLFKVEKELRFRIPKG